MSATAGQNFTAAFGAHTGQEAMDAFMHSVFRLIGTFDHCFLLLLTMGGGAWAQKILGLAKDRWPPDFNLTDELYSISLRLSNPRCG